MRPEWLFNADHADAVPADCLRARANAQARVLARSQLLLRRKHDGRFLAAIRRLACGSYQLQPLHADCVRPEHGLAQVLACLGLRAAGRLQPRRPTPLKQLPRQHTALPLGEPPLNRLLRQLDGLGIDAIDYTQRTRLALVSEPPRLLRCGNDRFGRPLWLHPDCATQWLRMRRAAGEQGVLMHAVSGFRGFSYQRGIIERKLARGQRIADILAVNTAPGFSEHHSGRAIDIGTTGEPPAEESFEHTAAFAWLSRHAADFGFRLSYPRDNPHGIVYEPWHWYWRGPAAGN